MTASDLAAMVITLVMIVAIIALALLVQSLLRAIRDAQATLEQVRSEAMPLMAELRATVRQAGLEVERVDDLLDAAESISATVDSATRLGYLAFRAPVIRVVAFGRGVGRGTRALTGRPSEGERRRKSRRLRTRRSVARRAITRKSVAKKDAA
ncbi:MAG: hypothetical protein WCK41_01055 [Actinomycetes bacterium]